MKISATEEYGLRCLLRVAENGAPITAKSVASKEGISQAYAQKLLKQLADGGVVAAKRGAGGGFHLVKTPQQLSVGEVLRALGAQSDVEGHCVKHAGDLDACCHTDACSIKPVWSHMLTLIMATFDALPVSTLLSDAKNVSSALNQIVEIPKQMNCPITGVDGVST